MPVIWYGHTGVHVAAGTRVNPGVAYAIATPAAPVRDPFGNMSSRRLAAGAVGRVQSATMPGRVAVAAANAFAKLVLPCFAPVLHATGETGREITAYVHVVFTT